MAHVAIWLQYVPVNTMTMELQKSCTEKAQISVWAPGFCCGFRWSPTLSLSLLCLSPMSPVAEPELCGTCTGSTPCTWWAVCLCSPATADPQGSALFQDLPLWTSHGAHLKTRAKNALKTKYIYTHTHTHIWLKSKMLPINLHWCLCYYLEWRSTLSFHHLGRRSFPTDTFLKEKNAENYVHFTSNPKLILYTYSYM